MPSNRSDIGYVAEGRFFARGIGIRDGMLEEREWNRGKDLTLAAITQMVVGVIHVREGNGCLVVSKKIRKKLKFYQSKGYKNNFWGSHEVCSNFCGSRIAKTRRFFFLRNIFLH